MNIEDFVPYDTVKSVESETHVAAIESIDLSTHCAIISAA